MYEVSMFVDQDSAAVVLWTGDNALEAWWKFVAAAASTGSLASAATMEWFSERFNAGDDEIFCNGYVLTTK